MIIKESVLLQPRVVKLKLKEVYEKSLTGQQTDNVYLYKFVLVAEQTHDVSELNVVDGTSHEESTIATMFGRSSLQFTGSEILGLTSKSFEVVYDKTTQREKSSDNNQFPDSIEITADLITNSIDFRYFITDSLDGLEIIIESIMKNKVNIDSMKKVNVEMNEVKIEIQEVGITSMGAIRTRLHKGYNWHSISDQRKEPRQIEPLTYHENPNNIRGLPSLLWPGVFFGLPRKRTAARELKSKRESDIEQQNVRNPKRTIILILELINHQRMIMITSGDKKIGFIRKTIMATLQKWDYYPRDTEILAARCRPFGIRDIRIVRDTYTLQEEQNLGEQLGEFQIARCAVLTNKPRFPAETIPRATPESQRQKDILFKFQSSYVLLRNLKACNRAAENMMNPRQRIRFNVPEIRSTGWIFSEDLGGLIICVAHEVKRLSMNLLRLSNMMAKSEDFIRGSDRYEDYKKTIQNVMDAAKYSGPLFRAISRFTIPLQSESPRRVDIV